MVQSGFSNITDMDKWILSFTNSLIEAVHREMKAYRLYAVVSPLTKYFDILTNCYIRLNRRRFKAETTPDEEVRRMAISALGQVLVLITRLMSPFTPFYCEYLWNDLRKLVGTLLKSLS